MNTNRLTGFNKMIRVQDVYRMYLLNDVLRYAYGAFSSIPPNRCLRVAMGQGMWVVLDCALEEGTGTTIHAKVIGALRPDTMLVFDDGDLYQWRQYSSVRLDRNKKNSRRVTYKRGNRTEVVQRAIDSHQFTLGYQVQWLNDNLNIHTRDFQHNLELHLRYNQDANFF